jgi:beta-glucosidase
LWGWFVRELFFCEGDRFIPENKRLRDADVGVATAQSIYSKPYAEGAVEKVNALLEELSIVRLCDGLAKAADAAKGADVAVVVIGNHTLVGARECIDRDSLDLPTRMTALLESVAKVNPNTILCVVAGYPYALGQQEKLSRAVLFTTHGAQELGTAIGEALAGDFSPAGRLSQTWYETSKGFPDINDYDIIKNKMTYLYTDKPVLHPFGYGLSYTSFTYKGFSALRGRDSVEAAITVQNTGARDSDEVVQLYLASGRKDTPRPRRQLCGFERLHLKRGEEKQVSFLVPLEEFAYFDERAKTFAPDNAPYTLMVGASSEDIRASEVIRL